MLIINEKRGNYMLRELWKLPFNPIYFFLKHFCVYTMTFTFASSIAFWHSYPFVFLISPFIFYPEHDFWFLALVCNIFWCMYVSSIAQEWSDLKVQKMRDVRIGLAGMLISVWVIIGSIFTKDSLHYWKISYTLYQIAMFSMPAFMAFFSSKYKKYFLQIDFDKYPYHKMIKFISIIGTIHVSFAAYFIQWSIAYLLILILTVTSFFFSVDLYTVMTAKSYMFREHYHYDWESQEILYHEEIVQTPDGKQTTIQWSML
ncbi:hypothetical protein B9Z55_011628 [Caenorhabditis nigoni]|uniref:Uncharacterized protein n=1 Tax=Caenorhabditis nigoni TaxID=1611254 RepID=A0A2G5UL02_9PELO|nr:hypothetical protein B9Z55_011628 [Caenorhabditis nigoni]